MSIIKCDENSNIYAKMRQCLNAGIIDEAEHCLAVLEESNYQAQLDLKNEVADGPSVSSAIGMLAQQLKRERVEQATASRGRSPGAVGGRNRSASANRGGDGRVEQQVADLRRHLSTVETENDKLKTTMREMVDDYTRQLELRDETIKRNESSFNQRAMSQQIDELSHENRMLKDKNGKLSRDLDMQLTECDRLRRDLQQKDRQLDQQIADKKNEWAEVYGNQKLTVERLNREIDLL